jgi:SAM-dependent methyltransferase
MIGPNDKPVGYLLEADYSSERIWDREYNQIRAIPSSERTLPSKALLLFEPLIDFKLVNSILDAGCGNGRNAIHLATKANRVIAADFSQVAISATMALCKLTGHERLVAPIRANLLETFPFPDGNFDLVLDSYVSCHFLDEREFARYWSEVSRVTKPHGHIFCSMFSKDDEYYEKIGRSQPETYPVVRDPVNDIAKRLYDEQEFLKLFPDSLAISYFVNFKFFDLVLGHRYRRSLFVALLERLV